MTARYSKSGNKSTASDQVEKRRKHPITIYPKATIKKGTAIEKSEGKIKARITDCEDFFNFIMKDPELKEITAVASSKLSVEGKSKGFKSWRAKSMPIYIPGSYRSFRKEDQDSYSPCLVFDIDNLEIPFSFIESELENVPFIFAAFPSQTGKGIRIWVWTKSTPKTHRAYYAAICRELSKPLKIPLKSEISQTDVPHIDDGTTDAVNQIWFANHVPADQVYINWESQTFCLPEGGKSSPSKQKRPPKSPQGGGYIYEFTIEEKFRDMVRQIVEQRLDLTAGKTGNWFKIGVSIAHEFGDAGREAFHEISQFHPGYNRKETDKQYDECLARNKGKIKINTFFKMYGDAGIKIDNQRLLESRRSATVQPAGDSESSAFKLIIEPIYEEENKQGAPDNLNLIVNNENNCFFWIAKKSNGEEVELRISNFTVKPLYLLRDASLPKRIWELTNTYGEKAVICFPVKHLSTNEFAAIIEGKGNYVANWSKTQLSRVKEYLFRYEAAAEEITILGYQPESHYYAFADGIFTGNSFHPVNEFGICKAGDKLYYLPAFSSINEDAQSEYNNERKFIFRKGTTNFKDWSKQFVQIYGDNAKIGICYAVSSLFRDIFYSTINCFPILFLFGPKGTGKTYFRLAMKLLFGNYGPQDTIGLESASSPKGFARKLGQIRNGLESFEEYKNSINDKLIGLLKNVYDGIGYERAQATNDLKTHSSPVNSAVVVAGQEMPVKENALFSRVILLTFSKTKYTPEEKASYDKFKATIEQGLGFVLMEIFRHRGKVKDVFQQVFSSTYQQMRKDPETQDFDERTLTNVAAILTPFRILENELSFPFSYADIYAVLKECVLNQHKVMSKTNEVNQFWQVFDNLTDTRLVHNRHYLVKHEDDLLYIHLPSIYPEYYEQAKKQNLNALDQNTLESYLKMQPYFERPQGGRNTHRVRFDGKQKRCLAFKMKFLELDFLEKAVTDRPF